LKSRYPLSVADKKRTEIDWQDIRIFLALGRHGSLSAAARALSVNHATISRRIQSLEAAVGEKLVERRPEGYLLTSAGTRTMERAVEMEAAVQALERKGADQSPRGLVRVNAPPGLSQGFLVEHLATVPSQYPGLDIELASDIRSISLDRHQADIAIRVGRPTDGDFLAKQLGRMAYGFYGTLKLCRAVAQGAEPAFVTFDEEHADLPEAMWIARHFPRARIAFRANNHIAQATAARAGAGLALLPHYIARRERDLKLCDLSPVPANREIWLLSRRQDRKNLPVRTVIEHLVQAFAREQGLFES
jgi:molybdate transport repressor ModE-like protein